MSVNDKSKVSTSISEFSNIVLSSQHVTTANFMQLNVAKAMEIVPKQSVDITHRLFTRLEPMPVPTFGNAKLNTRAFFVPFRTVMPAFTEMITDSVYVNDYESSNIPQNVHLIKNSTFVNIFTRTYSIDSRIGPYSVEVDEGVAFDICVIDGSNVKFYILSTKGKQILKLLMSLGYKVDFNLNNVEFYHSALPLLCLFRVYYDWYYPSAYSQDEIAIKASFILDYDDDEVPFDEFVTSDMLARFLNDVTKVCYNSDYFVSAWDNPVAPSNGSFSSSTINDITIDFDSSTESNVRNTTSSGTPIVGAPSGIVTSLSQYMIDSLKSLTDYMKRNQLAGARVIDRYLARYGVNLPAATLRRSLQLARYSQEIKFGDVTSTSDTEGANLGAFAGKGVSYGAGNVTFESDEFGILLILTSIVPEVAFYQGQDRMTMHKTKFDFYTGEFDNQGVQLLATREVYVPLDARKEYPKGTTEYTPLDYNKLGFGFVPRYAESKVSNNLITGDYILGSHNAGKDAWTLFRDVAPFFSENGIAGTKHDIDFVQSLDSEQYDRIFYVTSPILDKFNVIHDFNITSRFPGKPLYDTYEFENEDKAQKVVMEVNGVKAN